MRLPSFFKKNHTTRPPFDFDETAISSSSLAQHHRFPRIFSTRTRKFVRLDPLHCNYTHTHSLSLLFLLVHASVRRRNTERRRRSIGSRIRRSLGPPPTTRFRDPFSFIYHCLLRHFHARPAVDVTRVYRGEDRWKETDREGSPRPDSAVFE